MCMQPEGNSTLQPTDILINKQPPFAQSTKTSLLDNSTVQEVIFPDRTDITQSQNEVKVSTAVFQIGGSTGTSVKNVVCPDREKAPEDVPKSPSFKIISNPFGASGHVPDVNEWKVSDGGEFKDDNKFSVKDPVVVNNGDSDTQSEQSITPSSTDGECDGNSSQVNSKQFRAHTPSFKFIQNQSESETSDDEAEASANRSHLFGGTFTIETASSTKSTLDKVDSPLTKVTSIDGKNPPKFELTSRETSSGGALVHHEEKEEEEDDLELNKVKDVQSEEKMEVSEMTSVLTLDCETTLEKDDAGDKWDRPKPQRAWWADDPGQVKEVGFISPHYVH